MKNLTKKLTLLFATTMFSLMVTAQNPATTQTTSTTADSMHIKGDTKVDGYLIVKHIKSPDGNLHIGDSSMSYLSLTNQTNPIKGTSTNSYEYQSTSSGASGMAIGWNGAAPSTKAMALGYEALAYGDFSFAFGSGWNTSNIATETDAPQSTALGTSVKTASTASLAIALGSGTSSAAMTHSVTNSLGVGFNSTIPTFFVGPGSGAGTLGSVGIGTTSPLKAFNVNGDMMVTSGTSFPSSAAFIRGNNAVSAASNPDYTWCKDSTTGIFHPAANTIAFTNGNSEKMRITSAGKLGIGTTAPFKTVNVNGDLMVTSGTSFPTSAAYIRGNSSLSTITTPDYTWCKDSLTGMFHPAANTIAFTNGGAEKMRINSSGAIGIGITTTPSATLHVVGNMLSSTLAGTGNRSLYATSTGIITAVVAGTAVAGSPWQLGGNTGGGNSIGTTDNIYLPFITNNTEKMRINTNGAVGIGLTSTPSATLDVLGTIRASSYLYSGTLTGNYLQAGYDGAHSIINSIGTALLLNYSTGTAQDVAICTGSAGGYLSTGNHVEIGNPTRDATAALNMKTNVATALKIRTGTKNLLNVDSSGHVIIGATTGNSGHTSALLLVKGEVVSQAFYVTNNNWSDFVFDKNYNLMPLAEVEKFYTTNHHLPNVPTEKDIKENGNNLGETDAILLQKVEELTLYMVQQQKQIDELKKQNEELAKKLNGKK